jgi:thioredoxin reductase
VTASIEGNTSLDEKVAIHFVDDPDRVFNEGKLVIERMELDDTGFPSQPESSRGSRPTRFVLVLGQETDLSLLDGVRGIETSRSVVTVDRATTMTGHPGIFAGGDVVPADRTVTVAIGHGRRVAREIDAWLHGARAEPEPATFESLNAWYYSDAPRQIRPELDAVRRGSTSDEAPAGASQRCR